MKTVKKNIIICGATATGKTNIAQKLALELETSIVSADSMQIYKKMNVGTAKEALTIQQHMIDVCEPDENFSVYNYSQQSKQIISSINDMKKVAIICGGTGLYIDSILYKMNFGSMVKDDALLKERIENDLINNGSRYLFDKLLQIDPDTALKLHVNNTRRLTRALYLCLLNNQPISEIKKKILNEGYDLYVIDRNREELRNRINIRVEEMFQKGLKEEVVALYESGYGFDLQSMQAIGYKEWKDFFSGIKTETQIKEIIKINTIHYAKRQVTWFKNQYSKIGKYTILDCDSQIDDLVFDIINSYKEKK